MSTKVKELYVCTTERFFADGLIKVGECEKGRSEIRMKELFGAGSPEKPFKLWLVDLPAGLSDKNIHAELEKYFERIKRGAGTEWFAASVDDVKRAFNFLTIKINRAYAFSLRSEQVLAVDKATKWFNKNIKKEVYFSASHKNRFLLNAKMRFGKCFTSLHIAKKIAARKTLVLTYKPEVLTEWMEAANDHVDFDGVTGIRARKSENPREQFINEEGIIPVDDNFVVCVSLQDLWVDENNNTKKRLNKILSTQWDLVIFDEVHFGSLTDRAQNILKKIKYKKRLDLSGTPFRLLEMEDFCKEQIFTYSYLEEQNLREAEFKNKNKEVIYRAFPSLDISTIDISESDINDQLQKYYNSDFELSLNKLFEVRNGVFKSSQVVDHFIESLCNKKLTASAVSIYGAMSEKMKMPMKKHSVWWVSNVNTARALARKLNCHSYFKNYTIINAAGSDCVRDNDLDIVIARERDHVKHAIGKSIKDMKSFGTITITVKRFLTGVTVKEWDSILVLNDVSSPEEYYQAIFRIQSPWVDVLDGAVMKQRSWVFDFSLTRCLRMNFHYADAIACERLRETHLVDTSIDQLKKTAEELCSLTNLTRYFEGSMVASKTTAEDVFSVVSFGSSRTSLARRITSDALVNFIPLKDLESDPSLYDILKKIKGYRTQEVGSMATLVKIGKQAELTLVNNRPTKKSTEEIERDNESFMKQKANKEIKKQKKMVATQVKRLAISMSDFIYMTKFREFNIDHVIKTKEHIFFKNVTGITKDDFEKLCKIGFINRQKLNEIVREFRIQEESSLNPEEYIWENIKKAA